MTVTKTCRKMVPDGRSPKGALVDFVFCGRPAVAEEDGVAVCDRHTRAAYSTKARQASARAKAGNDLLRLMPRIYDALPAGKIKALVGGIMERGGLHRAKRGDRRQD